MTMLFWGLQPGVAPLFRGWRLLRHAFFAGDFKEWITMKGPMPQMWRVNDAYIARTMDAARSGAGAYTVLLYYMTPETRVQFGLVTGDDRALFPDATDEWPHWLPKPVPPPTVYDRLLDDLV